MRALLLSLLGLLVATAAFAGEAWEPGGGLAAPSAAEARGRDVYRAEVCWTCHGPQARAAVNGLERPGPVRTQDWLLAHLHDPRRVHPHSPMPGWPQLFTAPGGAARHEVTTLIARFDADGDGRVAFTSDARPSWQEHGAEVARMTDLDV
ncbi:MAG: hypothetical protein P1V36_12000, partial [Planctomycetota bacterium]|nr:hypothetical protein [Planctomycetota bacterium]